MVHIRKEACDNRRNNKDSTNPSHLQILLSFFMGSFQFIFKLGATHHEPRLPQINLKTI